MIRWFFKFVFPHQIHKYTFIYMRCCRKSYFRYKIHICIQKKWIEALAQNHRKQTNIYVIIIGWKCSWRATWFQIWSTKHKQLYPISSMFLQSTISVPLHLDASNSCTFFSSNVLHIFPIWLINWTDDNFSSNFVDSDAAVVMIRVRTLFLCLVTYLKNPIEIGTTTDVFHDNQQKHHQFLKFVILKVEKYIMCKQTFKTLWSEHLEPVWKL